MTPISICIYKLKSFTLAQDKWFFNKAICRKWVGQCLNRSDRFILHTMLIRVTHVLSVLLQGDSPLPINYYEIPRTTPNHLCYFNAKLMLENCFTENVGSSWSCPSPSSACELKLSLIRLGLPPYNLVNEFEFS